MGSFIKAAKVSDIPKGSMKPVAIGGKQITIANVDGEFFALDDNCTHENCSLSGEGFLDGNVVTCGCHGSQFDVTTGKVMSLPAPSNLLTYPTKVDGDDILLLV